VYLARLLATDPERDTGYITLVVRDDDQVADFVYRVPGNTHQAYNNCGGKSLYPQHSVGSRAVTAAIPGFPGNLTRGTGDAQ